MTPWRKRDFPEPPEGAREAVAAPVEATIEAWLNGEPMEINFARLVAEVAVYRYLGGELCPANRQRVEELLRTDLEFRAYLEKCTKRWNSPEWTADPALSAHVQLGMEQLIVHLELKKDGIHIPFASHRARYPGRSTREALPPPPLDPIEFVERLAGELGTHPAKLLVRDAFRVVEASGDPDPWIIEVARARERGSISADVAHFLIWQLAESAIMHDGVRHPELSKLTAEIERIEREHGVEEGTEWISPKYPRRWRNLYDVWEEASARLMFAILVRTREREVWDALAKNREVFGRGRRAILGI